MEELTILYILGAVISLFVTYWLIKLAVRSALIEVEEMKGDYFKKEKERIDKMLAEKIISPDEYYQRTLSMPVKIVHEKK
jgi:hypothetical protein